MKFEDIKKELLIATKEKDLIKKYVLKDIIMTCNNMAIAKGKKNNISEELVTDAIMKTKKIYQEQLNTCPAERVELMETYKSYLVEVEKYVPKMFDKEEVFNIVKKIISEEMDEQKLNKGIVMKTVMPRLKGKAEGHIINEVVTEILS